jgi:hypothetical protein
MNWFDSLMDRLTRRGTKLVASGHPPADTDPATGSRDLSEELQAGYGGDTPAARPPDGAEADGPLEASDEIAPDELPPDATPPR